ncbi:MAG: cytochrome c oxidase subunit II [Deltaproteobacteria bacterium]|nr:cytochrome c oxidase subunit II [Deltaproteobacteria bacterium]
MLHLTQWLVVPASTFADDIDFVFGLIFWMVGFWYVLSNVAFFYLLFKYRAQPGKKALYVTGTEHDLLKWVEWPHYAIIVCDIVIIAAAVKVWYEVKQDLPPADAEVTVVAQQWAWSFVHPGADNKIGTSDDIKTVDELHLEVDKVVHWRLQARDVLHSFSVPAFRIKQDAIPGRDIMGWFEPNRVGTYDIQCAEICGIGHGIMGARVIVHTPEEYAAWVASSSQH